MPIVKKTLRNPHGLSNKQRLVIDDIVADVEQGKPINPVKSTGMIYNTKNKRSTAVITSQNLSKLDFRQALIEKLSKSKIIGKNSRIAHKLEEGLDAIITTKRGHAVDYKTRLAYIQEINKITGVYAPEKSEKKTLNLHIDMSEAELQEKITQLQQELTEE